MKTIFPLLSAIILASACTASALTDIAVFKAENAQESSSGFVWKDSNGSCSLETKDRTGISMGDKPDKGSDGKSVVFSGEQPVILRTTTLLPLPTTGLKVSLLFKPAATPPAPDQTLVRQSNWELRYNAAKSELGLVVWHEPKNYSSVAAPITPDAWNEVVASVEQGVLKLEVNGVAKTRQAKGPPGSDTPTGPILVGAAGGAAKGSPLPRPLCGALADIHISSE